MDAAVENIGVFARDKFPDKTRALKYVPGCRYDGKTLVIFQRMPLDTVGAKRVLYRVLLSFSQSRRLKGQERHADAGLRQRLGTAARARFDQRCAPEVMIRSIESIFSEIVDGRGETRVPAMQS